MDLKLEVVVLPVADVDRAKAFYTFGTGVTAAAPGSLHGPHLIVADIDKAVAELTERGVAVEGPFRDATGVFHHAGTRDRVPGPDPQRRSYGSFAAFTDPEGNGWFLQEITQRAPGR
jgi:hypothetical protein